VKLTATLERVLRVLVADPAAQHYGYDLMKAARLASGTLYPMLGRLQEEGLITSQWEQRPPDGRPPRKYYQLTGEGLRAARLELARASQTASARSSRAAARPVPGSAS
jgi:PadR family transcriptional regulator, regulatory protein PadR